MSTKQLKKNRTGKKEGKSFTFSFFTEYKFYLVIAVAITFMFFIGTARSGTFFGLTLNVNTDLENGLVGHWTFDGTSVASRVDATGGTITTDGDYSVHTFSSSGTYTPTGSGGVEVLVVGGGGAGGGRHGGGAGGGGVVYDSFHTVSAQGYAVVVGSGGTPTCSSCPTIQSVGGNGSDSTFDTITALGGGGGGSYSAPVPTGGGSGGGGAGAANTTAGLSNQGDSGGGIGYGNSGGNGGATGNGGGGGGGAVFSGTNSTVADTGGAGGNGIPSSISGASVTYGGGGGGGGQTAGGAGGSGGGGAGGNDTAVNGTANLGGGGGGVRSQTVTAEGGSGGSGVVIIRALAGSSAAVDRSENSNTGSLKGTDLVPGRLGSALSFDGSNDYVDIAATGETIKAVAFWMKADSLTEDILDLNGTADVTVSAGTISANSFTSPTIYIDGEVGSAVDTDWRHVVITTATGISASNMDIGRANGGYFDGKLDDVRIYNRVLSTTEITRLAELGMTTKIGTTIYSNPELESGLLGHWTLDGKHTTNTTATDRISTNDGTINGNSITATTTYATSFDVGAKVGAPQDVQFNNNGTKMFIPGNGGNDITAYSLSVPYDLSSTVTFLTEYSVVAEIANPTDVAFNNDGTKMFITGYLGDDVNEYTLSIGYDLTSTVTFITSVSVLTHSNGPSGLAFNEDGSKLFVTDSIADYVSEYAMSTPFTLSSMTYTTKYYLGGEESSPDGIVFNNEGTKMFIQGTSGDDVNEFTLSVGYDLSSTITHIDAFSISAQDGNMKGITMNEAGTKLFAIADNTVNAVYEYALTEGFDLGGTINTSLATQGNLGSALEFDGVDDYVDISGVAGDINESTGSMAVWVYVATGDLDSTTQGISEVGDASNGGDYLGFRVSTLNTIRFRYASGGTLNGVSVAAQGNTWKHYVATWDATNINLYEDGTLVDGPIAHAGTIGGTLLDQAFIAADASAARGNYFKGKVDDLRIYDRVLSVDQIKRLAELGMTTKIGVSVQTNPDTQSNLLGHWTFDGKETTLATSTDIGGANDGTFNGGTFTGTVAPTLIDSLDISGQAGTPTGIRFSADGSKLFLVGNGGQEVNEYKMTTDYDISTASFVDRYDLSAGMASISPQDLDFNTDGTIMFIVDNDSDDLIEYTLSTEFDVSTASLGSAYDLSGQDTEPRGIKFNTDGTKMFVNGTSGDDVNEYTLSIGFDITSTVTFIDSFDVSDEDASPWGLDFNADGTKMFILGFVDDNVLEYALGTGFDVSTASYVDAYNITAQETFPVGLTFKPDGMKMFAAGIIGQTIDEYTLNYSYDIAGTVTDSTSFAVPGKHGSALKFDGNDDYVDIGATGGTVKTVAFWIKVDDLREGFIDYNEGVVDLNGSAQVLIYGDTIDTISFTSPTIYVDGEVNDVVSKDWHHVVITTNTGISASDMEIAHASTRNYFQGKIDDVRIYSTALSGTEVTRLYQTGI